MRDYCLKFDSFEQGIALVPGYIPDGESAPRTNENFAVDIIGTIPDQSGFHVNLRIMTDAPLPEQLEQFVVYPEKPYRVWA